MEKKSQLKGQHRSKKYVSTGIMKVLSLEKSEEVGRTRVSRRSRRNVLVMPHRAFPLEKLEEGASPPRSSVSSKGGKRPTR